MLVQSDDNLTPTAIQRVSKHYFGSSSGTGASQGGCKSYGDMVEHAKFSYVV